MVENVRADQGSRLSVSRTARAPVALPNDPERIINFNDFPFCLAFTVTITSTEARYLMTIMGLFGENLGSLRVGREEIIFTLGGTSAIFNPPDGVSFTNDQSGDDDFIHLQICVDPEGVPTLYINCVAVQTAAVNLPPVDTSDASIIFLNNATNEANSNSLYTVRHYLV